MLNYFHFSRIYKSLIILFCSFFFQNNTASTQTVLQPGDLLFTAIQWSNGDGFEAITFRDLCPNTVIYFSDNPYENSIGFCNPGNEYVMRVTILTTVLAGSKILFDDSGAPGTITCTSGTAVADFPFTAVGGNGTGFNNNTDNCFAFQGNYDDPIFICGIKTNANWTTPGNVSCANVSHTELPSSLTNGVNAIVVNSGSDAVRYNCAMVNNTIANLQASIMNTSNWSGSSTHSTTCNFTVSDAVAGICSGTCTCNIWSEDFNTTNYPSRTTVGGNFNTTNPAPDWTTTFTDCDDATPYGTLAQSYWGTINGEFLVNDVEGGACTCSTGGTNSNEFLTEVIDISGYTNISICAVFRSVGSLEPNTNAASCNNSDDVIQGQYRVNGGPWLQWFFDDDEVNLSPAYVNSINGSTLQIKLLLGNKANDEYYYVDNICVSGTICASTTPTFTQIPAICSGGSFSLPPSSNNGISGAWSPAINNTSTTVYTFTPTAGQCAGTNTMTVTVNNQTVPNFAQVGPYCQNEAAPALSTSSTNGINGAWSPALSTATIGTISYTFTPTAGQCATNRTMDIAITAPILPNFTAVGPYCQNEAAPALSTSSTNGINGTWSPALSTATIGTTTYTFTPTAGQCATNRTIDIAITAPILPNFTAVGPYCQNEAAPALSTSSTNGINGSWSPALSTATIGTTTYTFTPTAGQCATNRTIDIAITAPILPNFTAVGPYCQNEAVPALSTSSTNGINGAWSPALSTATIGTTTYTFTPTAGQCATNRTIDIAITAPILPNFTAVGPYCQNEAAPALSASSTNGINGSWSPALSTATIGTTTYTFTPTAGQCATSRTMDIAITAPILPNFTAVGPYCQNEAVPALSTSSTNGINGTWSPALSTATIGTTSYTFTPTAGQCATNRTMDIAITAPILPNFTAVGPYCQNEAAPALSTSSTNGINGSWSPALSTATIGTTTYTFIPTAGQCATNRTMDITINMMPIAPNAGSDTNYCSNTDLPQITVSGSNGIFTWYSNSNLTNVLGTGNSFDPLNELGQSNYYVTETIEGCESSVSIVTITIEECDIIVPTAFTPDGDNVNDYWEIINLDGVYPNNEVTIYNRWGSLLYQSEPGAYSLNPWKGEYKGEALPVGSYYFIIDFNVENVDAQKGIISIILE